jgi:hypothetical protein
MRSNCALAPCSSAFAACSERARLWARACKRASSTEVQSVIDSSTTAAITIMVPRPLPPSWSADRQTAPSGKSAAAMPV